MNENYTHMISKIPLFDGIREEDIQGMLICLGGCIKKYNKDEFIIMKDENVNIVGIVLDGSVRMIREDLWGNRVTIVSMGENELFGETFSCRKDGNATVSFVAGTATTILTVQFRKVMNSCSNSCAFHHRLIENMVTLIAEKNVILMDKVDILSKKTIREKISTYLIQQSMKNESKYFDIPLGRVQLAEFLNVDRSSLTRELNNMRDEGLIDFDRNSFHMLKNLEQI